MKHHLFSRFTSVLLAVVLLAGLMGTPILATDNVLGAEPAATVEEQTAGSVDESASGVDSAAAEQAEEITTDEEESASSDSSTDTETSGEEVVTDEETDRTVPAGDESDSTVTSEEESTDSAEGTEPVEETDSTDETEPAEETETTEATIELTTSVLDENGSTVADVTAEAAAGVIPEGATLVAELLTGEKADKAAAELNEAGVEYDGYMALDIHLENYKGEEVEPNGEVRVVMVAPAALPEEADPTTVAVQHHEELDNGEVKVEQVASAADTAALAAAPATLDLTEDSSEETPAPTVTTDNSQVTADFTVESFSKFTITWTDSTKEEQKATVFYVEEGGSQILVENLVPDTATAQVDFSEYVNKVDGNEYTYQKALLNYGPAEIKPEGYEDVTAVSIRYTEESGWEYRRPYSSNWIPWTLPDGLSERRIFLVYKDTTNENNKSDPGQMVDTVDTNGKITINLFDYSNTENSQNDINEEHYLYFSGATTSSNNRKEWVQTGEHFWEREYITYTHPNFWTTWSNGPSDGVLQGIVQNCLDADGNPVLQYNSDWNWDEWSDKDNAEWPSTATEVESLGYLFNPDVIQQGQGGVVKEVVNANNLFQQDADGYYYFDSAINRAVLNEEGNFEVYSNPSGYFSPFSSKDDGDLNDLFGMTIETTFVMPEDGLVNGQPMTFEFSGDDDVWVFIDGVLVLDMGGNHGKATGSINFNTGAISIDKVNRGTVGDVVSVNNDSITARFEDAGKEWNNTVYETHTLKFFYLERGSNQSNCKIRFNLPIVPDGSLSIAKELEQTGSEELQQYLTETVKYKFRVLKKGTTGENPEDLFITQFDKEGNQVKYEIWENGVFTNNYGDVAADGTISLKAGQMAVFPDVINGSSGSFYVQELIPENANGQYGQVSYNVSNNGGHADQIDSQKVTVGETSFESYNSNDITPPVGDQYKNESYAVYFTNVVNTENMALLKITKYVPGGAADANQSFKMKVLVNEEPLPVGTEYTLNETTATVQEEGVIELHAGDTASILMLAGEDTSYKVVELMEGVDQAEYEFGSYTGTSKYTVEGENINNVLNEVKDRVTGITNTVTYAGQVDEVTVTNNTKKGYLTINKKLAEDSQALGDGKDVFTFKIQKFDDNGNPTGTVWYMYADGANVETMDSVSATLDGTNDRMELESGTYLITELSNINYTCDSISESVDGADKVNDTVHVENGTIKVSVGGSKTTNVTYTNSNTDKGITDGSGVINDFSQTGQDENIVISFVKHWIAGDTDETADASN